MTLFNISPNHFVERLREYSVCTRSRNSLNLATKYKGLVDHFFLLFSSFILAEFAMPYRFTEIAT